MQILDGRLLFSATDLVNFLGCRHATFLDLRDLTDPVEIPERDAATVLIFEKGIEHEIQLTTYSKLIGNEQDRVPARMHIQLGNNERVSLRVSDFAHYHSIAER